MGLSLTVAIMGAVILLCSSGAESQNGVCPGDLLIIIDNSGSVQDVFEQQKQTAKAVIDQLDVGTIRVALISYNQRAKVVLDFDQSQSKSEISGILANLSQEGGTTNTAESLQVARGDFSRKSRSEVTLLVLLITDGHSQNSLEDLRTNMAEFNKSGIVTLAASVSPNPDVFELSIYANGRADRTFLRNNLTQLPESIVKILGTSCNRQDIKEIAVFKPMPQISGSDCQLAIVIVFDNSESVEIVIDQEKLIATQLLQSFTGNQARLSLIHYSDSAKVAFSLSDTTSAQTVIDYLKNLPNRGGNTNTEAALLLALKEFTQFDRKESTKVLLLLTDGHSENSLENLQSVSDKLKSLGVQIFVASAATDNGLDELKLFSAPRPFFLHPNLPNVVPEVRRFLGSKNCLARDSPLISSLSNSRQTGENKMVVNSLMENIFTTSNEPIRKTTLDPFHHVFLNFSYFFNKNGSHPEDFIASTTPQITPMDAVNTATTPDSKFIGDHEKSVSNGSVNGA